MQLNPSEGPRLDPAKEKARLKLYHRGWNDNQIGAALAEKPGTIKAWRERRGLPTHQPRSLSPEEHERRMALYKKGLTDAKVGEGVGASRTAIIGWRKRHGLKGNKGRGLTADEEAARFALYQQGLLDEEIGKHEGVGRNSIRVWRETRKLPTNYLPRLSDAEWEREMVLTYAHGLTAEEVAALYTVSYRRVKLWRNARLLDEPTPHTYCLTCERREVPRFTPRARRIGPRQLSPEEEARRVEAFHKYGTDQERARAVGISTPMYTHWRYKYAPKTLEHARMDPKPPVPLLTEESVSSRPLPDIEEIVAYLRTRPENPPSLREVIEHFWTCRLQAPDENGKIPKTYARWQYTVSKARKRLVPSNAVFDEDPHAGTTPR